MRACCQAGRVESRAAMERLAARRTEAGSAARTASSRSRRAFFSALVDVVEHEKEPPAQAVWLGCLDLYCYRWGTSKSLP